MSKNNKTRLKLELNGKVSLVEFRGSKRITEYPINSELVVRLLKDALVSSAKK